MLCLWLRPPLVWFFAKALAFCKFTIPLDSSWYARVTTGGATTMTPLYILNLPIQICCISKVSPKLAKRKVQWTKCSQVTLSVSESIAGLPQPVSRKRLRAPPIFHIHGNGAHVTHVPCSISSHRMQKLLRKITMRRNDIVAGTPGLVSCFG